jgi:hypothetical protein
MFLEVAKYFAAVAALWGMYIFFSNSHLQRQVACKVVREVFLKE